MHLFLLILSPCLFFAAGYVFSLARTAEFWNDAMMALLFNILSGALCAFGVFCFSLS